MRSASPRVYLVILAVVLFASGVSAVSPIGISTKAGPAKRWQAGVPITKFSTNTLRWGNAYTVIPLCGWGGTGPGIEISLYHNALSTVSGLSVAPGSGYYLGKGWTHSYGGQIISVSSTVMRILEDDGTLKDFTLSGSTWLPPSGCYDKLTPSGTGWELRYPDQSRRKFDADGRLTTILDSSNNAVDVFYETDSNGTRISYVTDARGRRAYFNDTDGQLTSITVPFIVGLDRSYTLSYDEDELESVADPMTFTRTFEFDSAGRIRRVYDENNNASLITYTKGLPSLVNDPEPFDDQEQSFEYDDVNILSTSFTQTYTDRRNKAWTFTFANVSAANLTSLCDPLSHCTTWTYDSNHNPLTRTNALGKTWTFTYDSNGNRTSGRNPFNQKWTSTFDSFTNNLLTVKPPADSSGNQDDDKAVTLHYDDSAHATSATDVTQPAPAEGGDPILTTFTYYSPMFDPAGTPPAGAWSGQLASVVDQNGVMSDLEYDTYGQLKRYREGLLGPGSETATIRSVDIGSSSYPGGGNGGSDGPAGGGGGSGGAGGSGCDLNNRPEGYSCLFNTASPTALENSEETATGFPAACSVTARMLAIGCPTWDYDNAGNVLKRTDCVRNPLNTTESAVEHLASYDELDRPVSSSRSTEEPYDGSDHIARTFEYDAQPTTGVFERGGPDGDVTRLETDDARRPTLLERDSVIVTFVHDDADRLTQVVNHGSGTVTSYAYDDADRVVDIKHARPSDNSVILELAYTYTSDGMISQIAETGAGVWSATTTYTVDRVNRLTRETRTGSSPFDLEYSYDAGGNRRTKTDWLAGRRTTYYYDIDHPSTYGTNHNRLIRYEVRNLEDEGELLETVWYSYARTVTGSSTKETGWVQQVIRKIEGDANYYRNYFMYDTAGRPWILLRDRWTLNGSGQPANCTRTLAREYRYDSGQARYLVRELDASTLLPASAQAGTWTDYDGDLTYADYFFPSAETTSTTARYMPGNWEKQGSALRAHHGDEIGSSRAMTSSSAAVVRRTVYTAFGERVLEDAGGSGTMVSSRYGYAGEWGYEQDLAAAEDDPADLGFIHIGERWYDPGSGRFLQRDPIGVFGGINAYAYVGSSPLLAIDPAGMFAWRLPDFMLQPLVDSVGAAKIIAATGGAGTTYTDCVGDCINDLGPLIVGGAVCTGVSNVPTPWRPPGMGPSNVPKARLLSAVAVKTGAARSATVLRAVKALCAVSPAKLGIIGAGATAAGIEAACAVACGS